MFGQVSDPFTQNSDLHLGRSGVVLFKGELGNELLFALGGNRHRSLRCSKIQNAQGANLPTLDARQRHRFSSGHGAYDGVLGDVLKG